MKITQPELSTALRGLRLVKPSRTTLPVLDCVHLSADGSAVELTATDLHQRLTFKGELAESSPRLTRLVPLSILQRVVKELPKETMYSFEKDRQIACHTGNLTSLVPYDAPAPGEFPPPIAVEGQEIELSATALTALQEARFVASDSVERRNICCVCLEPTGAVATDGRQLFHANTLSLPIKNPCLFPPHKALGFFDGTAPALLRLPATGKKYAFTLRQGAWTWQSKFLDEVYPNWRKVLPAPNEAYSEIKFSREDADRLRQIIGLIPRDPRKDPIMALVIRGQQLHAVIGKAEEAQTHELHPMSLTGPDAHAWISPYNLLRAFDYGFGHLCLRNAKTVLVAKDAHRKYLFMPYSVEDDKLPAALRPPVTTAPEQNNPPTNTETNPTNHPNPDPMSKTTTATAPANAPELPHQAMPTTTTNGQSQPVSAADRLMSQWLEARESARVALERFDNIRGSLKNVAREYRELEKEHEALKKSVRSLQKLEV
jgi:DNA polymerase-3 subunit beta